jgi:hypothetical protein
MTALSSESFVPLTAGTPKNMHEEFRVLVAPRPENARPLLDSKPELISGGPHTLSSCQPKVTLHRDGDRISGIHIQCSCGQIIDLTCSYTDTPHVAPAAS